MENETAFDATRADLKQAIASRVCGCAGRIASLRKARNTLRAGAPAAEAVDDACLEAINNHANDHKQRERQANPGEEPAHAIFSEMVKVTLKHKNLLSHSLAYLFKPS